jgi:hypothetical protein
MLVGEGDFRYEEAVGWEQIPNGWSHGDVAGIATDPQGLVYVFNRGEHPLLVYNRDGSFNTHWGEGVFTRPHGITIKDGVIYLADDGDHTVRKFTMDGTLLQTLGTLNQPSATGYDPSAPGNLRTIKAAGPFHRPTRLSVAPNGDYYVSDGYGNSRIHHFKADGTLVKSWGQTGSAPGEFNLPHSVWVHTDGRVFVCDRENDRVQIFTPEGEFLEQWPVRRPGDLYIDADENVYIGEMYYQTGLMSLAGNVWDSDVPAQMTVRDLKGSVICRFGGEGDPTLPGNLVSPHGIWVDDHDDIYVGEVTQTSLLGRGSTYRPSDPAVRKYVRIR